MRASRIFFFLASVVFLAAASPASAQSWCDKTYIGPATGDWTDDDNWFPPGEPDETENVCIPGEKTVFLVEPFPGTPIAAHARALWLQRNIITLERASLLLLKGARMHIYEDSSLMGNIDMEFGTILFIENDLTISGDGGEIKGLWDGSISSTTPAKITMDNNARLTIASVPGLPLEHTVLVHGHLLITQEIGSVASPMLINNGYIIADRDSVHGILIDGAVDGVVVTSAGGFWMAENGARLRIDAELQGSGTIKLVDSAGSRVRIEQESLSVFGPVIIEKGTLTLFESFTTTGNLTMESVGGSVPMLVLKNSLALSGTVARFGN